MCEHDEIPGKHPRCNPTIPYGGVEKVWRETQQLMEKSERLFRIMTHVCPQQLTGVFRTVAKYSQGKSIGLLGKEGRIHLVLCYAKLRNLGTKVHLKEFLFVTKRLIS